MSGKHLMFCVGVFYVLYFNMREKFCQVFFSNHRNREFLISVPYFFCYVEKNFSKYFIKEYMYTLNAVNTAFFYYLQ